MTPEVDDGIKKSRLTSFMDSFVVTEKLRMPRYPSPHDVFYAATGVPGAMKRGLAPLRRRLAYLHRLRRRDWTAGLSGFGLALALFSALPVFLIVHAVIEDAERGRFVAAAEKAAYRLAHEVDRALANLRALTGLYEGSVHVSRSEFSAFVRTLQPSAAVKSLQWIPSVPSADRSAFEMAAREDGVMDFSFRQYDEEGRSVPAAGRSEYFPIYYVEPYIGNEAALGLDLGADPISLEALQRARDSGRQTVSGRIRLGDGHVDQFGFSVFEPIYYQTAMDLDTRINYLHGFAHGVFRIIDLVQLAIPEDRFHVALFDRTAPSGRKQLYPPPPTATKVIAPNGGFQHEVTLKIADREWSVRLAPSAPSGLSTLPWVAALCWLAVLAVLWVLRELVSSRRHSQQLAAVNQQLAALSDQRKQAIQELERSNRELDDFAYIASHDLKEPLRAIFNHANFVLEDQEARLDQDGMRRLNRMISLSQRMQKLIDDLLFFSRLGRGGLAKEAVDLEGVIADIEVSLAESLQQRNAKLVVATSLPEVRGHRPHMTALFQNLVTNAMKYNDSDEKLIEIGYMPNEAEGRTTAGGRFYVRDNGIGIDERHKDDVFRIFKRLNSERAYGEGTGAGLSFVKKIVESHGGTIWLSSAVGAGTTFFFTLGSNEEQPQETYLKAA